MPHADLPENNHQPMEGTYCFMVLLIRLEILLFLGTVFYCFLSFCFM